MTLKSILYSAFGVQLIALYLRVIYHSARKITILPETGDNSDHKYTGRESPVIYVNWHGQNYLFAPWVSKRATCTLLAARHGDGNTVGRALSKLGVKMVYGGGSSGKADANRGGAQAFLKLLRLLKNGEAVMLNADVPKASGIVADGALLLARKSGAPIAPHAIASTRRKILNNWDRTQIHLPFSKIIFLMGEHIYIPNDGTPIEDHREKIKTALDDLQARAFELADSA